MPCWVVVSTAQIKTLPDFTPCEIFPTHFHSDHHDAPSVVLLQDFCPSDFVVDHDWSYTKTTIQSMGLLHQITVSIICQVVNSIENSGNTMCIKMKMPGHTHQAERFHTYFIKQKIK
jgi:hypothetical protein